MDTTEKNIKMLEKAPEIQALCQRQVGDVFYDPDRQACDRSASSKSYELAVLGTFIQIGENTVTSGGYDYDFYDIDWSRLIWLPHQGQLQEMVDWEIPDSMTFKLECLVEGFGIRWAKGRNEEGSFEQLWLAFVMKEKWHKVWDDQKEDWVN